MELGSKCILVKALRLQAAKDEFDRLARLMGVPVLIPRNYFEMRRIGSARSADGSPKSQVTICQALAP